MSQTVRVVWREWVKTWGHVSGYELGVYQPRQREFTSEAEARGFMAGMSTNPIMAEIRMERL